MFKKGKEHPNFKGEDCSYRAIHFWVQNNYGKPRICEDCGTTTAKKFEWANISGKYRRDIKDWKRLCTKCHRLFDMSMAYGERHGNSKLNDNDVMQIIKFYKEGKPIKAISVVYDISVRNCYYIINNKTWTHLGR